MHDAVAPAGTVAPAEHEHEHDPSTRFYYVIFAVLMALLLATIGAAYINLGPFNFLMAMSIATVKAVLVVLYFMHVRDSRRLTMLFAGSGFAWLLVLIVLTFNDYLTRRWLEPADASQEVVADHQPATQR